MTQATQSLSAARVASLVHGFDRSPAYAGLADALVLLIGVGLSAYALACLALGAAHPRDLRAALQRKA